MQAKEEPVQTFKGAIEKLKSPKPIKPRDGFVSISRDNLEAYPNEMLEVLHGLASAIATPGFNSKNTIENSFKFFGNTRTPKIVDETTYQAVTALESYLNYLIDNGLEKLIRKKIPKILGPLLNGVDFEQKEEDLKNIKKLIAIRKQNYENHKQENINQQILKLDLIVIAYERLTTEHKNIMGRLKAFDQKLETIAVGYLSLEQNSSDGLNIEELLREIEDLSKEHNTLFTASIDGEFEVSDYILAHAFKKSKEKQSQAQLKIINSDAPVMIKKSGQMILKEELKQEQSNFNQLLEAMLLKISTLNHLSQLKSVLVKWEANFTDLKKLKELLEDPHTKDVSVIKASIEEAKLLEKEENDLNRQIERLQKIIKDNGNYQNVVSALSKEYDKQQTPYQQRLSDFNKNAEARLRQLEEAQVLNDKNARKEKIASLQDKINSSQDAVKTLDQKLATSSKIKEQLGSYYDGWEKTQKGVLESQIFQIRLNTLHLGLLKLLDDIEAQSDVNLHQSITRYGAISKTLKKLQKVMDDLTKTISDYMSVHQLEIKKSSSLDMSDISEAFKSVEEKLNNRVEANNCLLNEIKALEEELDVRKACFNEKVNTDSFLDKYKAIAERRVLLNPEHPEIIALKKKLDEIDVANQHQYQYLVANKASEYLKEKKEEFKTFKEQHQTANINTKVALPYITNTYFHPKNGKFESYLSSRYKTYWFKDGLSSAAALFLGCFGYKSDAIIRQEYISELKNTFETYQKNRSENALYALNNLLDKGARDFRPRRKHAEAEDQSLRAVVQALRQDLEHIDIKINTHQNKP